MGRALAFFALGLLLPMAQGVAAAFAPARFVPDLGLLYAVALGLFWPSAAGGLVLVCALGFATDLLSGALLGQHALLRMLAFGSARTGSRQLNLRGPVPQAIFVAALTAVYAVALGGLTAFFGRADIPLVVWRDLAPHALVNAVFTWPLSGGVRKLAGLLGDEDAGRRLLRLEPRGRTA